MQIFHRNVLIAINLSLQKIFSSTEDKEEREESSDYDSLYVKRKGEIPLASQLTIAYENGIVKN